MLLNLKGFLLFYFSNVGTNFFFPVCWSAVLLLQRSVQGFYLWLTGRAGYWLGEIGSGSYFFLNPVTTTLLLTILQTMLISAESSKKTKLGKDVYFGVGKSSCITTSMNPMWVSCSQVREETSTWFLKAGAWKKTSTESAGLMLRHELLPDWKDFRWRQWFPAFISVRIWFKPGNGK